jgi:hypothetical protein
MKKNPKRHIVGAGVAINCAHDALVPPRQLKPNPDNPNRHGAEQLRIYAKIIRHQGWRRAIVVSNQTGLIVSGHGAWMTATAEQWPVVPVDYQDFQSRADEFAHLLADNKLPQLAELDDADWAKVIEDEIGDKLDLDLTGFDFSEVEKFDGAVELGLVDEPDTVKKNLEHLADIKSQRARGNKNIIAKTDTEFYLVIAFPNRGDKEALLKRLKLPSDERYLSADSVMILPGATRRKLRLPKASPPEKSGACG